MYVIVAILKFYIVRYELHTLDFVSNETLELRFALYIKYLKFLYFTCQMRVIEEVVSHHERRLTLPVLYVTKHRALT